MILQGKNAVITGCSRGIGLGILRKFHRNGANIWACIRKPSPEFSEMCAEMSAEGGWVKPVCFDMENDDEIKAGIKGILSEKLPVDILVNNAGISSRATLHMMSMEEMHRVYQTNYFSQMLITQLVTRYMIRKKSGCVINMSSVSGLDNAEGTLAYGGSKSSVAWSTKTLAVELGKYGIRVNAIAPGLIDTDMIGYQSDEQRQKVLERNCIKRMGSVEDVANAAVFLASDLSSYITGQILRVDGGRV
ncbi:MAG: SDR family NAD(P)-dependent oxidoreductase [Oscillospiraceae bacterium]